jgi:hypothetical protein
MRIDHVEGPLHILLVGNEGQPYSLVTYLYSLLFYSLFEFYIGEEDNESMMDHLERRGKILAALALYWLCFFWVSALISSARGARLQLKASAAIHIPSHAKWVRLVELLAYVVNVDNDFKI